jgi:hypothetical protein
MKEDGGKEEWDEGREGKGMNGSHVMILVVSLSI